MVRVGDANPQLELGLVTQPGDLFVRKTTPDSFLRTDLEAQLTVRDVNHPYICGFASEFCVDTTVRCAAALGYLVTLSPMPIRRTTRPMRRRRGFAHTTMRPCPISAASGR